MSEKCPTCGAIDEHWQWQLASSPSQPADDAARLEWLMAQHEPERA